MATSPAGASPIPSSFARTVHGVLVAGSALWCAAIVAAPLLERLGGSSREAAALLYTFFHPICHQLDSHSLHLAGAKLGVCTRCFSVYASFLLTLLLYPRVRSLQDTALPNRLILAAAVLPMVVDVGLSIAGAWASTPWSRLLTGSAFGAAAAFFLVPAAVEGAAQLFPGFVSRFPPCHHSLEGFSDATET